MRSTLLAAVALASYLKLKKVREEQEERSQVEQAISKFISVAEPDLAHQVVTGKCIMCCYCCISLRGAVYFGTSVHIFIGVMLFLLWGFEVYVLTFESERLFVEAFITIVTVLLGIYLIFFIMLGCLIFRGVEKRSLTLLKWSATGFTTLQVLVFTVILILYFVSPDGEWSYSQSDQVPLEKHIMRISIYFLSLVATANYIIVLILYIRKLWKPKYGHKPATTTTSGTNNTVPQISSPISQPMTHYYRRGLQSDGYPAMPYRRQQQPSTPRYMQKQHNPGVYECVDSPTSRRDSLNSQCQPFYPANFYAASIQRGIPPPSSPNNLNTNVDAIYNQSQASTTSFMHRYPYPHERYRFPLDSPRLQESHGFRTPQPQQEQVYQQSIYGGSVRGRQGTPTNGYDQSAEPLLRRPNEPL